MSYVEEGIKEVIEMTPEDGFNVCYFDDFADVGEKLTLIKHCETREEAEEIVSQHEDEPVYIYEGEDEAEETISVSHNKNHNIDKYLDMALQDYEKGKNRPNEEYEKTNYGGEADSSPYEMQRMLDDIVSKSLNKKEKKEIEESEDLIKDFSLDTLLGLIADRLSKKIGKKLGVESKQYTKDDSYRSECQICGEPLENHPITDGNDPHEWLAEQPADWEGDMSPANEGGRGSGRVGHQKWMLGTEVGEECPNCMMITERDNGKCVICGE